MHTTDAAYKKVPFIFKTDPLSQCYAISAPTPLFFQVLNLSSMIAAPTPVVAMLAPMLTFRNVHFVMKIDSERMENLTNDSPIFHLSHS